MKLIRFLFIAILRFPIIWPIILATGSLFLGELFVAVVVVFLSVITTAIVNISFFSRKDKITIISYLNILTIIGIIVGIASHYLWSYPVPPIMPYLALILALLVLYIFGGVIILCLNKIFNLFS